MATAMALPTTTEKDRLMKNLVLSTSVTVVVMVATVVMAATVVMVATGVTVWGMLTEE